MVRGAIDVRRLSANERDLEPFLELPSAVYRGDPDFLHPFRDSVLAGVRRATFAAHQQVLLAVEGGRPSARLVARISPFLQGADGRPVGMLGFFEALDRPDVVRYLFEAAIDWLKKAGAGTVVGPMDGDTWHSYRLNAGPHDERPFLLEPYNPPYYPDHWERNGFEVLERYYSLRVDDLPAVVRGLEPKSRRVLEAGYRLESLRPERFERELIRFYELSCRIFADNFLYNDISRHRFMELYSGTRALIDADLIRFAVAPDGSDAGFLFALPDRFRAVAAMKGSRGLAARLRFLVLRGRADTVNLKSLGVVPEHRRSGLGAALMHCGYHTALAKGYRRANLCLILDDNPSGKLDAGCGSLLRRYHLYRWCEELGG
jgi:GNAT superfamily N-acetyltransferase